MPIIKRKNIPGFKLWRGCHFERNSKIGYFGLNKQEDFWAAIDNLHYQQVEGLCIFYCHFTYEENEIKEVEWWAQIHTNNHQRMDWEPQVLCSS